MEDSTKNIAFISIAVLVLIGTVFFFSYDFGKVSLSSTELEECKSIGNVNPNAINILFFSSKLDAEKYSSHFFKTAPYSENQEKFNIYYIDTYNPACEIYRGVALFCHSKELSKKASSCPHDYIAVIDKKESKIRSSAYLNVMSINSVHPLSVFIHEFGHVFANFAEEYNAGTSPPKGSPNCLKICDETKECFQECSNNQHSRTIHSGVMRTLSTSDYGQHNINILEEIINKKTAVAGKTISGNVILESTNSCLEQSHVLVGFTRTQEKLEIQEKQIFGTGCTPSNELEGYRELSANLLSSEDEIFNTEFTTTIFTDGEDEHETIDGETLESYSGISYIKLPYSPNTNEVQIKDTESGVILAQAKIKNRPCPT